MALIAHWLWGLVTDMSFKNGYKATFKITLQEGHSCWDVNILPSTRLSIIPAHCFLIQGFLSFSVEFLYMHSPVIWILNLFHLWFSPVYYSNSFFPRNIKFQFHCIYWRYIQVIPQPSYLTWAINTLQNKH